MALVTFATGRTPSFLQTNACAQGLLERARGQTRSMEQRKDKVLILLKNGGKCLGGTILSSIASLVRRAICHGMRTFRHGVLDSFCRRDHQDQRDHLHGGRFQIGLWSRWRRVIGGTAVARQVRMVACADLRRHGGASMMQANDAGSVVQALRAIGANSRGMLQVLCSDCRMGLKSCRVVAMELVDEPARVPKLQQLIQEFFTVKALCESISFDGVVAYGVAVQIATLTDESSSQVQDMMLFIEISSKGRCKEHHVVLAQVARLDLLWNCRW